MLLLQSIPGDFIKQMSKSFAQVVRMDEGSKEVPLTASRNELLQPQMSKTLTFLSCFVLFFYVFYVLGGERHKS